MDVSFQVVQADALRFGCDVLVLKYAQRPHGLDEVVASRLRNSTRQPPHIAPAPGDHVLLPGNQTIGARQVLFVGVTRLALFRYDEIRTFARQSLQILAQRLPETGTIGMTVHGVNAGLDEREAFRAQLAGLLDALHAGEAPAQLRQITIVERSPDRTKRLQTIMSEHDLAALLTAPVGVPTYVIPKQLDARGVSLAQIDAGQQSNAKPHVFVAMPFRKDMEDVFFYGIQKPAHDAGYLCERMDMETFTGDILARIKERIETARLVIADLTGANPNVYLEVGYAWGKGRPTLLIAKQGDELKFDVQGQRCVLYESIRDLEQKLQIDLARL